MKIESLLSQIITFFLVTHSATNVTPRKIEDLLCVKFLDLSLIKAVANLRQNMKHAQSHCSAWAVVSYKANSLSLATRFLEVNNDLRSVAESSSTNIFYIFHTNTTVNDTALKSVLYQYLLPYLPYYKAVFLIDEDFSLQKFKFKEYFKYLNCNNGPLSHTLVSQPLVKGKAYFSFHQQQNWTEVENHESIVAVPSMYIEQQAPILDSQFFMWFIKNILFKFYKAFTDIQNGWGFDDTWCEAARQYSIKYPNRGTNKQRGAMPQDYNYSCAVIVMGAESYVTHLDFKTIKKKDLVDYQKKGDEIVIWYINNFPQYMKPRYSRFGIWKMKELWLRKSNFSQCNRRRLSTDVTAVRNEAQIISNSTYILV